MKNVYFVNNKQYDVHNENSYIIIFPYPYTFLFHLNIQNATYHNIFFFTLIKTLIIYSSSKQIFITIKEISHDA